MAVVNIVDAVLAAVLCVFAARGYVKGLFREVFALLGLAVGAILSLRYFEPVSLRVDFWPYSPFLLRVIVFTTLFLLVYIGLNYVGLLLHRSANLLFLGGFNRLGGLLVGGAKGAVFMGVALFFLVHQAWIPQDMRQEFGASALAAPLYEFGQTAMAVGASVTWRDLSGSPGPDATGSSSTGPDSAEPGTPAPGATEPAPAPPDPSGGGSRRGP